MSEVFFLDVIAIMVFSYIGRAREGADCAAVESSLF